MQLFEVVPDDAKWGGKYLIDAVHTSALPGVSCASCGETWSNTGLAYPSINLQHIFPEDLWTDMTPVTVDEYERRQQQVAPLVHGSLVLPGTEFGHLTGTMRGKIGDFAWLNPWTLLVRNKTLLLLQSADLRMPTGVPAKLTFTKGETIELSELQIEPHANLAPTTLLEGSSSSCPCCNRKTITRPDQIVIERASVPENLDLFRAQDLTTLILATERFAKAIEQFKLTDILLQEVKVS